MPRHAAAAVTLVYVVLAMVSEASMEDVTEQTGEDALLLTSAEGENDAFTEIEGFAMRSGATVLPGETQAGCENKCLSESECRSFSYRLKDSTCIWSTSSLTFDPDFMFGSKTEDPTARKQYREFEGMSYRTQGWTIVHGVDTGPCAAMCTATAACKAYSSRTRDKLCLLGPKGITYSMDFNYFEKKGIPYEPFPLLPPGGAYKCTGSLCPPEQDESAEAPAATEDPQVQAMEGTVKVKVSVADKAMAKAESDEAAGKAEIQKDKLETSEAAEKLRAANALKLGDEEQTLIAANNERLAKEEETLKLDFANAAVQGEASQLKHRAEAERERATKDAWTTKKRAELASERELKDGQRQTSLMLENIAAENVQFQAVHKMIKSKQAEADAHLEDMKKDAEDSWIEEKEEKKVAKEHKELKQKQAGSGAALEVVQKLAQKRMDTVGSENAETMMKMTAEANQKSAVTDQANAREMALATTEREKVTKQQQNQIKKEMEALQAQAKDAQRELTEVEAKKFVTLSLAHAEAEQAGNEMKYKASNATEYQTKLGIKAQAHAENLQKLNEAELIKVKEVSDKKEVETKEVAQKQATFGQELAEKISLNATANAASTEQFDRDEAEKRIAAAIQQGHINEEEGKKLMEQIEQQGTADYQAAAQQADHMVTTTQNAADEQVRTANQQKDESEAAADAQAKIMERNSKENAYKEVRTIKKQAMEKLGILEKDIVADVATFVDSGQDGGGTDIDNARNTVQVAVQREKDALAALNRAKAMLEDATAGVQSNEKEAKENEQQNAADAKAQADAEVESNNAIIAQATAQAAESAQAAGAEAVATANANAAAATQASQASVAAAEEQATVQAQQQAQTDSNESNQKAADKSAVDMFTSSYLDDAKDVQVLLDLNLGVTDTESHGRRILSANNVQSTSNDISSQRWEDSLDNANAWGNTDLNSILLPEVSLGQAQAPAAAAAAPAYSSSAGDSPPPIPGMNATEAAEALNELGAKNGAKLKEAEKKATDKAKLKTSEETEVEAQQTYDSAVTAMNEAKANLAAIENTPANTAYGAEAEMKGECRVLTSGAWQMVTYLKFPQSTLSDNDVVMEANLRLFKFGGGAGPVKVHTASCEWTRQDITFTMAEGNGGAFSGDLATQGDDNSVFPEGEKQWVDIKLNGDSLQRARIRGEHICLRVSGGPSEDFTTIASEQTEEKPNLIMYVKPGPTIAQQESAASSTLSDADQEKVKQRGLYRIGKEKELRDAEEAAEKERIVNENTSPDGPLTKLQKEKAVYEKNEAYASLYDAFAGLSQSTLEEERDASIEKIMHGSALASGGLVGTQKEKLLNEEGGASELSAAGKLTLQTYTDDLKTKLKTCQDTTEFTSCPNAVMQATVRAEREKQLADLNKQIEEMRCKSVDACALTATETESWEARAQAKLTEAMTKYDDENGTTVLSPHDVMTAAKAAEEAAKEAAAAEVAADVTSNPASDVVDDVANTTKVEVLLQLSDSEPRYTFDAGIVDRDAKYTKSQLAGPSDISDGPLDERLSNLENGFNEFHAELAALTL